MRELLGDARFSHNNLIALSLRNCCVKSFNGCCDDLSCYCCVGFFS